MSWSLPGCLTAAVVRCDLSSNTVPAPSSDISGRFYASLSAVLRLSFREAQFTRRALLSSSRHQLMFVLDPAAPLPRVCRRSRRFSRVHGSLRKCFSVLGICLAV